jgi:hypothetical protein
VAFATFGLTAPVAFSFVGLGTDAVGDSIVVESAGGVVEVPSVAGVSGVVVPSVELGVSVDDVG